MKIKTKFPLDEIINNYLTEDISLRDLAKKYHSNHQSIGYLFKKSGVPIKDKGEMIATAWKKHPHPRLGKKGPLCPVFGHKHSEETKQKLREMNLGSKNCRWKTGKTYNSDGYVLITINGKQILEHRLVMAKTLGRELLPEEIIHHKNERKADNNPENLEVTTRKEHIKTHKICGRRTA